MGEKAEKFCFDGSKLRTFREEKAITQQELEYQTENLGCKVNERTIRRLENGDCQPNLSTLRIIAKVLGKEPADFYAGQDKVKSPLNDYCIDFNDFIEDRTKDFVGRDFIFDKIDNFIGNNKSGYFIIKGDPGIGKSSIMASLVKDRQYIHHFNIAAEGINKPVTFLKNICAQLIIEHQLDHTSIPAEALDDGKFFQKLLSEAAAKLQKDENIVLVVDSLDEVDEANQSSGVNILYLPPRLPDNVYIITTVRDQDVRLRMECPHEDCPIIHDSPDNKHDIRKYLDGKVKSEDIKAYLKRHKMKSNTFTDKMLEKSEGNFMYLRHVLPEIENGVYQNLDFSDLPSGLESYYEDHWRRMKMNDDFFKEKVRIIYVLSEARCAVSTDLLKDFTGEDSITIQSVLDGWKPFLHKQKISNSSRYSIYHGSFKDFLNRKDIIQAAGVTIKDINNDISDSFFDDKDNDQVG